MNIYEQIKSYKRPELICFFNLVFFEKESLGEIFIKKLKCLEETERNNIIVYLKSLTDMTWLINELEKTEIPSVSEQIEINKSMKDLFSVIIPKALEDLKKLTEEGKRKILADREILRSLEPPFMVSDQMAGIDIPPVQKELTYNQVLIPLPEPDSSVLIKTNLFSCIQDRKSHRKFSDENLSLAELSFLLWGTQGVREVFYNNKMTRRNVPSGGSRHPFETYLAIHQVEGLKQGIYRYQPLNHALVFLHEVEDLRNKIIKASANQDFAGNCAVTFIWSVIPYRTEWRYGLVSKKDIMMDCGHLCQNLYLACEGIGCGTCAILAYNQKEYDSLLQLDGVDEFVIYLSPVGKI